VAGWLLPRFSVSLSPFSKLSNPKEVINGFSSYSSAFLPNYGKAQIAESQACPGTRGGHCLLQAPASRQNVKGDSVRPGW
jgi:hypothetical protein